MNGARKALSAAPDVVNRLGFTEAGVAARSTASWLMSRYGGQVTKGSVVSTLQSIGAAGMGPVGQAVVGVGGAIAGLLDLV